MGCAPPKLDNEDTVRRCKERRRLMKEAVYSCHHLAAAHSDYCRSLRMTGSTLVTFASGEPFSVSDHAPAVLRPPTATEAPIYTHRHTSPSSPSPSVRPPPPPPPMSTTSSHYRHHHKPPRRRRQPVKLPHVLSDSSFTSSPPPNHNFTHNARANSTYSTTPSQTSSVWHWDNFYPPPSPPDSEYFDHLKNNQSRANDNTIRRPPPTIIATSTTTSMTKLQISHPIRNRTKTHSRAPSPNISTIQNQITLSYSRFTENTRTRNFSKKSPEGEGSEEETEREEVQCSEWGDHDHYSSTSDDNEEGGDLKSRSGFRTRSDYDSVRDEAAADSRSERVNLNSKFPTKLEKISSEDDEDDNGGGANSDTRIVVRHKDLAEKEHFLT